MCFNLGGCPAKMVSVRLFSVFLSLHTEKQTEIKQFQNRDHRDDLHVCSMLCPVHPGKFREVFQDIYVLYYEAI